MKPAPFAYHAPRTLDEALALLAAHGGDAKPLAGGQSLVPAMNFRLATPAVLVDLNRIEDLAGLHATADGGLAVRAMTRQAAVERSPLVPAAAPLLAAALPWVAHAAIRHRGTIGGSLAHADPAAELPAVMLALDATFTLQRAAATRTVAAADFFSGLFATALLPDELLTAVQLPPRAPRTGCAFQEISRRHGDFALAGVAACVAVDDEGRCTSARAALLGVGDRPMLAEAVTRLLVGQTPTPDRIRDAAEDTAAQEIDPPGDIHASSDYRRRLAAVLLRRTVTAAFEELT